MSNAVLLLRRLLLATAGHALAVAAVLAYTGACSPSPLANLEPARQTLAAYLDAWRTLDFKTMHATTILAALAGQTPEQYETTANQTLLENAIIASHMRYAVGAATADAARDDAARVKLSWTIPNMARALRVVTDLTTAGVGARDLLDRVAPLVASGTIPLETHELDVLMVFENGRWKVDPSTMKVGSHHAETTSP